jgi:hypothetical protein
MLGVVEDGGRYFRINARRITRNVGCGSSLARQSSRKAKANGGRITEQVGAIWRRVLPFCDKDRWKAPAWRVCGVWGSDDSGGLEA